MTNGDKGGTGVKNWDFYGDILFEWPLIFVKRVTHNYSVKVHEVQVS